jgi:hypothetical protein
VSSSRRHRRRRRYYDGGGEFPEKKKEKEITHILNGPNHTQDIQRWESGDELNKYLRKKEMRKMIEISGGNYL